MKRIISSFILFCLPLFTFAGTIEGVYLTQPESYRISNDKVSYEASFSILISDNGDGTYHVDDLFGGWYSQRQGYGVDYCMGGNIAIDDGKVTLIDSYVPGWGDSLVDFIGTYDESASTFYIEAEYVNGMKFIQTWVKDGLIFTKDGINYSIREDNTAAVRKGNYSGDLSIPSKIEVNENTYLVTSIDEAFIGCDGLKSVFIPNSVTSLGNKAFTSCRDLISVNIPNSVNSIGDDAFMGCIELKEIEIPNSVTSIGNYAFYNCISLESVVIPNSVTSIGSSVFSECYELRSLTLSNNIKTFGDFSFTDCDKLEDIVIPYGLTTISSGSFIGCKALKTLTIPETIVDFSYSAFTECGNIESITVDKENNNYDSRNNCNAIIETNISKIVLGCKNTIIPVDIKTIGPLSFAGCEDLETIIIPNSVTSIEHNAFWKCKSLKSIIVGSNLELIDGSVFQECPSINDFYNYAQVIPATSADVFIQSSIEKATLHVPAALVETYKNTAPWNGFGSIVALTDDDPKVTGIHSYTKDDVSPINTYTLDGKRVQNPQRGISIIRMSDGTTKKVIKK